MFYPFCGASWPRAWKSVPGEAIGATAPHDCTNFQRTSDFHPKSDFRSRENGSARRNSIKISFCRHGHLLNHLEGFADSGQVLVCGDGWKWD